MITGILVWLHLLQWGVQGPVALWHFPLGWTWGLPLPVRGHLCHAQARSQRQRRVEGRGRWGVEVLTDGQVRDLPLSRFGLETPRSLPPVQVHPETCLPQNVGLRPLRPLQGHFYWRLQVCFGLLEPFAATLKTTTLWPPSSPFPIFFIFSLE